jgi:hypothetical protein
VSPQRYIAGMQFEKVWIEQCRATRAIKRRFGAKSALDYLIGEKLMIFADAAKADPNFADTRCCASSPNTGLGTGRIARCHSESAQ